MKVIILGDIFELNYNWEDWYDEVFYELFCVDMNNNDMVVLDDSWYWLVVFENYLNMNIRFLINGY